MNNDYSSREFNSMMADAIKRARAMQARGRFNNQSSTPKKEFQAPQKEKEEPKQRQDTKKEQEPKANTKKDEDTPFDLSSFLNLSKMLGIDNDRLIIFMLIMILASQKDSFYTVLALLYIAL